MEKACCLDFHVMNLQQQTDQVGQSLPCIHRCCMSPAWGLPLGWCAPKMYAPAECTAGRLLMSMQGLDLGSAPVSEFEGPEGGGEAIEEKQALRQRLPDAAQKLDGLQGLQGADDARGDPQDAGLPAAPAAGQGRCLWVQAPVARPCAPAICLTPC